ncbi:hypothetical protein FRC08_010911 [Ceratobasidium sp. 394]|nr:hypothetical protein FRC08_010911 [Ceratobasidium sp. 394]
MSRSLLLEVGLFTRPPEELSEAEQRWVRYYPYLLSKGYQLRPRYRPGWVPSWHKDDSDPLLCEDSWDAMPYRTLDALHVEDQRWVVLKMLVPSTKSKAGYYELEIIQRFSEGDFADDPRNHVVPCLDTFPIPDIEGGVFYVMPLLTQYNHPRFWCLDEIRNLLYQLFEGLAFLHQHGVAHCDIAGANIMMDGGSLYDEQFHPLNQEFSLDGKRMLPIHVRTGRPVRYYYIDFGFSVWNRDGNPNFMISGTSAREPAPEQEEGQFYDPFAVDVYQLGALIRRDLIPEIRGLRFLLPLSRAMTETTLEKRITLAHAQQLLHEAFEAQSARRMRWPIIPNGVGITRWVAYTALGIHNEISIFIGTIFRLCRGVCRMIIGT